MVKTVLTGSRKKFPFNHNTYVNTTKYFVSAKVYDILKNIVCT